MNPQTEQLKQAMELLLDIPYMQVQEAIEDRDGNYIVTLASTEKGTVCHKCEKRIELANGYGEWITLRHLPILGRPVYLRFRLPRYQCNDCDGKPTTTQRTVWFNRKSKYTIAFEKHLLLSCVNSTVSDVSIRECVGYDSVCGVIDRNVAKEVNWNLIQQLDIIGVDEISVKKGHKDFVVISTSIK